jgi:Right handed beta helix region
MRARVLLLALVATLFGVAAGPAGAVTRWVNDDRPATPPGTSCDKPGYNSIDAAVDSSFPGDTVNVCPGTYPEQVTVGPGKNGLTIRSVVALAAVIQAPPTIAADTVNFKAIVRISTSQNVTVRAFEIRGPGPGPCDSLRYGVRVDNGASAKILDNHITEIRDTPFSGCQNGVAVLVGRDCPVPFCVPADVTFGQAYIANNRIDRYQKNGPTVSNAASSAVIVDNYVQGFGPTPVIAQNGIQVSAGATGYVTGNQVFDNTYSLTPVFGSTGILLFSAASGTKVGENLAARNDDNVGVYDTSGASIYDNRLFESTFFDGIYMGADTSNNLIKGNFIRDSTEHDCHDDSTGPNNPPALVANRWVANNGLTENKPGLCDDAKGDDDDDEEDDEDGDDDDDHDDDGDDDDRHRGWDGHDDDD